MSTMQFLGRSSLRVRKLPRVNSSLLAKFMEEEGGVGIRKESQKICHCGRILFPVNQWFLCDKVFFFICNQCKSSEHCRVELPMTHTLFRFFGLRIQGVLLAPSWTDRGRWGPYSSKYHDVRDPSLQVNRAKQLKFGFGLCAVRAC